LNIQYPSEENTANLNIFSHEDLPAGGVAQRKYIQLFLYLEVIAKVVRIQ